MQFYLKYKLRDHKIIRKLRKTFLYCICAISFLLNKLRWLFHFQNSDKEHGRKQQ